tara:strand:+ start:505 stop:1038 length:534 start_codon:yes stop_codon:yes gene_type:complete
MAAIDQTASDKKAKERAKANKKRAEERKKARKLKKAYRKEAGLKWYQKAPKDMKEKAKKKSKAKETGDIGKKKDIKGVKSTKGGEYIKYGKKSKDAQSFREAFKAAKGKDFTWQGRKYSGKTADDVKKEKEKTASKAITKVTSPEPNKEEYSHGGKVESSSNDGGMFNWPSTDARKR